MRSPGTRRPRTSGRADRSSRDRHDRARARLGHELVGSELGAIDFVKVVTDLARVVEAAADLMGELPYRRYVFMHIGRGGGGLEHANSTAIAFDPSELDSAEVYRDWLSFVCHEYLHLFIVKRIRPLALGPFDYDRENYTRMVWVSEGISVYYEDLLLRRASTPGSIAMRGAGTRTT